MIIAFTAKGTSWDAAMDPRFGRTDYLLIYDDQQEDLRVVDNTDVEGAAHGAGPRTAKRLFDQKANVLITGNGPGGNAGAVLERGNIEVYVGAGNLTVRQAYDAWRQGVLKKAQ
ncbi:MAG: NifB/NifX family molybdenum-iron cluster-binding protein [Spirochaetota bacterium]